MKSFIYIFLSLVIIGCSNDSNEIQALTKPVANSPINNSVLTDNLSQKLDWENSRSVGLVGPLNYQVFFGESENSLALIKTTRISEHIIENLTYNKTYYWNVMATSDGKTESSEIFKFKIRRTTDIEKESLIAIYNSLNGAAWNNKTNWNTSQDISTWHGIEINSKGQVISLKLPNNNLSGVFPDEISNLKNLIELDLNSNSFNNIEFPVKITELNKLQILNLSNCGLVSNNNLINGILETFISNKIGDLASLKTLILNNNNFSGPLVKEWGNLKSLEELNISNNLFNGPISKEIGNLRNLKKIIATNNQFNGKIPLELSNIQSLQTFGFENNFLEGELPNFSKSSLKIFFVINNSNLKGNLKDSGLCSPNLNKNISGTQVINDCTTP